MAIFSLLTDWLHHTYFEITLWRYIAALAIIIASFFVKKVFELYIFRGVSRLFSKTSRRYDQMVIDSVSQPASAFVLVGGLYLAAMVLGSGGALPEPALRFLGGTYAVAIGVICVWAAYRLVDIFSNYLAEVLAPRHEALDKQFVPLIRKSLRVFVVLLGVLTILATLNVDVGSLIAGLGIGGVAVALAAQDTLGNFFGSMALLADKPFKVGDWIIVGNKVDGDVESIGFRSTTIRSWPKTLITIPNKVLANEVIDNWSRMPKRRVKQLMGVSYETTPEQMATLVANIEQLLREDEGVNQDFFLVKFTEFGQSSLDILLYYFTKSTAWAEHLTVRQRMNLKILEAVKEVGTSIAFPTRTLYLEGDIARQMADRLPG